MLPVVIPVDTADPVEDIEEESIGDVVESAVVDESPVVEVSLPVVEEESYVIPLPLLVALPSVTPVVSELVLLEVIPE